MKEPVLTPQDKAKGLFRIAWFVLGFALLARAYESTSGWSLVGSLFLWLLLFVAAEFLVWTGKT